MGKRYYLLKDGFCYLSLITDAFSRKIVGHRLWPNLSTQGCINALSKALAEHHPSRSTLIHHSDRGVQYCCNDYTQRLQAYQVQISMSHKGTLIKTP